ncbi:trimethylamine methyltransferase family protein [Kiloniella sp. b19]|uniref:trimethylamine methyltransferase family protein n=1 Tax=Kiloniella sp. GXU_MW_B19 TaxID=3141326 RepID=UPI0031DD8EA0
MTVENTEKPRTSRRNRREKRQAGGFSQLPWRHVTNPYDPIRVLDKTQIERIHDASMRILEDIGIVFLLDEARDILRKEGLKIDEDTKKVYLDREFVREKIALAPSVFTLHARNPERNLTIGGNAVNFTTVASAPNVTDIDNGRRAGNQEDYRKFIKLGQSLNIVHFFGGYPVEPVDIHPSVRHLDCLFDIATLSDKVATCYSLGRQRNLDAIELTRIARGISRDQLEAEPSLSTIINSNSPLQLDEPMLTGIIEMSKANQCIVLTPFTLAGAMAPVTIAGAIAQQNAEALAGLCFAQTVRAGAPVVYGGFTSNVDMKSGAPAFGTPEYTRAAQISGQLARYYGLPFRSSNVNASNATDAQAAYESMMAVWGAVMGGSQYIMHGAGWLEGGLSASFEKMIIDAEILQGMAEYLMPVDTSDDAFALEAIREVGPGGHFFGTAHTQERYQTAFYNPMVSDWRNYESWTEGGSPDATLRANRLYKQILEDYSPPPMDEAIREELESFVAKRKEEGGAPSDF